MIATAVATEERSQTVRPSRRIVGVDVFRGLTMAVMIFVNDLEGVRGLPWWTHHAHAWEERMTYVDMVFPFFLFIVGVSMPVAIRRRLERNPSQVALWRHILMRTAGLIVLGLILANVEHADRGHMWLSPAAWGLLGLIGGILFWMAPARVERGKSTVRAWRICGLCLLVLAYASFRRVTPDGHLGWIDGSYPEILGLIGYAYFCACLLYVPTRRWRWAAMAWFIVSIAWCAFATIHASMHLLQLPLYVWPFGNGSSLSLILAGIATSEILFREDVSLRSRNLQAGGFAIAALVAAYLLTPLGISKIRATPTWCLYSTAAAVVALALLHWICDVRGKQRWAVWVRPAGENTLLTYLLPDLYLYTAFLVGFRFFQTHANYGFEGVAVTVLFTGCMLAIAALLTRLGFRLQL